MTAKTSLTKLTEALTESGWQFKTSATRVSVSDTDNPRYSRYSSRVSYPVKTVDGVQVEASNKVGSGFDLKAFTAVFTEDGKYLARYTKGTYPFMQDIPLRMMLQRIESHSPTAIAARRENQEQALAAEQAAYDTQVAAAYAEAQEALTQAQAEVDAFLTGLGLTEDQARTVLVAVQTGKFGPLLNAKTEVENTGKGYLGSGTYPGGTYVDGKRVEEAQV
jgi:hypothetical protein